MLFSVFIVTLENNIDSEENRVYYAIIVNTEDTSNNRVMAINVPHLEREKQKNFIIDHISKDLEGLLKTF